MSTYLAAPLLTPTRASTMPHDDIAAFSAQKEDKLPHDASVFVGSLPSNVDQGDLTRLLMEHLSEHTQIKNIKVVRDNKGGVCAFVQCENATSATDLIQTLHSRPPNLFMGRILRYEPARAFRTLLVSYRAPMQIVRLHTNNGALYPATETTEVPLDLPHAMRVWKHRNSRFHSMMYNADAIHAEEASSREGLSSDNAILLHPLKFDDETLQKFMSYFGPLEKFNVLESSTDTEQGQTGHLDVETPREQDTMYLYLHPHNAPRSPSMDARCWEVKWEHRDDCVSALMTLKRVPHLTVTWAHQPSPAGNHPSPFHTPTSTSYSTLSQHQFASSQFLTAQHIRQRASTHDSESHLSPAAAHLPVHGDVETSAGEIAPLRDWSEDTDTSSHADYTKGSVESSTEIASAERDGRGSFASAQAKLNDTALDSPEHGAQELYMPPTPALDPTSISPLTLDTQFPVTPTSNEGDITGSAGGKQGLEKDLSLSYNHSRPNREIDPTTLFVGGLEMFGPGAWDEKKVEDLFSKFGGLESVKVVRPVNSCTAFAFVKFDNAESPARAVEEENNRVIGGRAMRVQLRDCNPPRSNWKNGRGRGRPYHNNFNTQRRFQYRPLDFRGQTSYQFQNNELKVDNDAKDNSEIHLANLTTGFSSVSKAHSAGTSGTATTDAFHPSVSSFSTVERSSPPVEKYREWYDEPELESHTPEPSSLGSSVSTAGMQLPTATYAYPLHQGPFFPPQPWIQHYVPHATYQPHQMSYFPGYPMYPPGAVPSAQPQAIVSPPNSDVGTSTMGMQAPWPHVGIYAPYIPYTAVQPRPGISEPSLVPPPAPSQAPLIPTGFIQNEQGTLIPVYQPEALDQYLASSGVASPPISAGHPSHAPIVSHKAATAMYPSDVNNVPSSNAAHATPGQVMNKPTPHPSLQPFSSFPASPTPFRGGADFLVNTPPPLYRRQGQRRDNAQQNQSSAARHHNHPRAFNVRSQRGHMHISTAGDLGHSGAPPAMVGSQWPGWNDPR